MSLRECDVAESSGIFASLQQRITAIIRVTPEKVIVSLLVRWCSIHLSSGVPWIDSARSARYLWEKNGGNVVKCHRQSMA